MIRLFFVIGFFISQISFIIAAPPATNSVFILSKLTYLLYLSTLWERGANPRINKAMYWLWYAQQRGESPKLVIDQALVANRTPSSKAELVEESLMRNWNIAQKLGLFESTNNLAIMRRGGSAMIMRGCYKGEVTEVDHMIPFAIAPEIGNEILNLELLPKTLNRRKSDYVGDVELAYAKRLQEKGILSQETYLRVEKARYNEAPPLLLPPPLLPGDKILQVRCFRYLSFFI